MARLRAAVIGAGYLGRFHAMKYRDLPGLELVGVADIRADRADEVAREMGVRAFSGHRDVIGLVDLATVAVPTTEHYTVASDLVAAGVHVLVEKPIAATLDEAERLVEAAQRQGVVLQVGHLERFNPTIQALRKRLTEPLFWECHRISPFPGRGGDVDVVLDLMIHDIDLILDILHTTVEQVDAVGVPVLTERYDIVNARIAFATGCVANLTASRVSAKSLRKIRVFQPDAYLSADSAKGELIEYRRLPPEGPEAGPRITAQRVEVEERDSLMEEVKSFVEAVSSRRPPLVDGRAGIRALEVALKVIDGVRRSSLGAERKGLPGG
jgi:predicted dehydrogenase